jgi:hypothetical protein
MIPTFSNLLIVGEKIGGFSQKKNSDIFKFSRILSKKTQKFLAKIFLKS